MPPRPRCLLPALLLAALLPAFGQQYSVEKPLGSSAQIAPAFLQQAGISQNLNRQLPLADRFRDSDGAEAALGSYFDHRPVVLALVYYRCRILCPQVLHGMATALRQVSFTPGRQYDVLVASIDPTDSSADGAAEKQRFLSWLGPAAGPDAAAHIHFVTAQKQAIDDLAAATGFHYVLVPGPDGKMDQFAHSSVIMIATPEGRMSKYLSGIDYQPRDVRLALIEAADHRIGSATDLILMYCCSYSPSTGRYTVSVLRILGLAAMGSIVMMGVMFYMLSRKPKGSAGPPALQL